MNFNFVGKRRIFYGISLALIIVALVSFFTKGFEQDIEFKGGTIIDIELAQEVNNTDIENIVKEVVPNEQPRVQKAEQRDNSGNIIKSGISISTSALSEEQKNTVITKIAEKYGIEDVDSKATFRTVKPTFGDEMRNRAIIATVISLAAIIIYIAVVFKRAGGISAAVTAFIKLKATVPITKAQ